ncbi:MAG TPA: O-antigen ligase family protein, partial [Thermomicrobiales bacterium]|nr:O-antigen ligase family protein [Thermomicrobiales bacterium]
LFGFKSSFRAKIGLPVWLASIVASGAGMLTLGLTQSRGGLIGMVVALVVVLFILPRRLQLATLVAGVVLIGAFLITTPGQSQVQRFIDLFEEEETLIKTEHKALLGRGSLWGAAIRMIEDEPLTGIGAGEYDYHYREYTPGWLDRFPRGQAHNGWLQMGAQAGVPGMVAFTAWVAASLGAVAGAIRRAQGEFPRLVAAGAFAILMAFTIHSLVDYLNVLSLGLQLSMITAAGLALSPDPLAVVNRNSYVKDPASNPSLSSEPAR